MLTACEAREAWCASRGAVCAKFPRSQLLCALRATNSCNQSLREGKAQLLERCLFCEPVLQRFLWPRLALVKTCCKIHVTQHPFPSVDRLLEKPRPASWGFSLSGGLFKTPPHHDPMPMHEIVAQKSPHIAGFFDFLCYRFRSTEKYRYFARLKATLLQTAFLAIFFPPKRPLCSRTLPWAVAPPGRFTGPAKVYPKLLKKASICSTNPCVMHTKKVG